MNLNDLNELQERTRELNDAGNERATAFQIDFPWSMSRALQLRWWDRYGKACLRYVAVREADGEVIHARPPDRFAYLGEESSRSERIARRHTLFYSYPVKVVSRHVRDLLGMFWDLPDGRTLGVKIEVNERTYAHEEEVAGA